MKSYLTTIAGALVIVAALVKLYASGIADAETISLLMAGAGLVVAKDYNVTGGKQ